MSNNFTKRVLSDFSNIARRKLLSATARQITFNKKKWRYCVPDNPPCAICHELIAGTVFRLNEGSLEITFHPACAIDRYHVDAPATTINDVSCLSCSIIDTCEHVSDNVKCLAREHKNQSTEEPSDDWMDSF